MLLIGFRSASGGLTVVSAANPLPVTGGGGGGGGDASAANQLLEIAALGAPDDDEWDGVAATASLIALGKSQQGAITDTHAVVGGEIAHKMIMLGPDGSVIDFTETTEALPQTEVNPNTQVRTLVNATGSGAIAVLALDAAKRHVITGGWLQFSAAGSVTFTEKGSTFTQTVAAGEKWILDNNPAGWWVTNVGEAFTIDPSVSMTITGMIRSVELD